MIYEDSAEDELWKTIDLEDIWILDKLILYCLRLDQIIALAE